MEKYTTTIITGLSALIIGLLLGYIVSDRSTSFPMAGHHEAGMHQHNDDHMHSGGMMHNHGNIDTMMGGMMMNLNNTTGADYEQAWLSQMIIHHEGAVVMAEDLLEKTDRTELTELANDIITTQSEEIDTMESWLEAWYKESN